MILEAKAKPVKFRIRSGGEEHSSLESLRSNFVWEDIKPLCGSGKQLEKWLERIDAEVAKEYKNIENTEDNVLGVYNVLFRKNQTKFHEYKDVFQECMALIESRKEEGQNQNKEIELNNLLRLCRCLIPMLSAKELIQSAKKYWIMYELFEEDLLMHMRDNQKLMSPEDLFTAGKLVFESGKNQELAIECIQASSSKGIKAASDFVKKHITGIQVVFSRRFVDLLSSDRVKKVMEKSWKDYKEIEYMVGYRVDEKNVFSFSNTCMRIYNKNRFGYGYSQKKEMYELAETQFCFTKDDDLMYQEKMFIMSLFDTEEDRAYERLTRISGYPPAKSMLETKDRSFVVDSRKFKLGNYRDNANHLDFYLTNLVRFRQSEDERLNLSDSSNNSSAKVSASDDSLDVLFKDNEIMECIRDSWQAKTSINPSSNRGMKNKLFMLSDACLNIVKASWSNLGISRLSSIAEHYIGRDVKKTDPLRDEKLFVLGLFGRTFDEARNRMIEIENSYPIAKFIARGAANGYNMYGDWESHLFSIRDNRRTENADHLEYFIKNLPKFRKDV